MSALLPAAQALTAAGLSVIPIGNLIEKLPAGSLLPIDAADPTHTTWKPYQSRLATQTELDHWFGPAKGLAVVGGVVSGNLTIIDFDVKDGGHELYARFAELLEELAPGLLDRLPLVQSPSGGHHLYLRAPTCGQPEKLAMSPTHKTWIETKAQGGYCLAPRSAGYAIQRGSLTAIPTVTDAERDLLLTAARSFNMDFPKPGRFEQTGSLPGAAFNARMTTGDMERWLVDAGWRVTGTRYDGTTLLARPGKSKGISATLGQGGKQSLYVFSQNADPFQANEGYSAFAVHTFLQHRGDFTEAAKQLARDGYGGQRTQQQEQYREQHDPGAPRRVLFPMREFEDMLDEPPLSYLLTPIVPERSFISIVGETGKGKTFVAMEIACRIVQTTGKRVLYISAEGGVGIKERYRAWRDHYNNGERIKGLIGITQPVYPTAKDHVDDIMASLTEHGWDNVGLIVFDTMARCYVGDENSTNDMSAFIRALGELQQATGAAIMLVHHTGWDVSRMRGNSSLKAALDVEVMVSRDELGVITVACTKMKDAVAFDPLYFTLVDVPGTRSAVVVSTNVAPVDAPVETLPPTIVAIREALTKAGTAGLGFNDLKRETGITRGATLSAALKSMTHAGHLHVAAGRYLLTTLSDDDASTLVRYGTGLKTPYRTVPVPNGTSTGTVPPVLEPTPIKVDNNSPLPDQPLHACTSCGCFQPETNRYNPTELVCSRCGLAWPEIPGGDF